jgi:DNA-binding transcriptional LysR family regulator
MPGVVALEPELRDLAARLRRLRQDLRAGASQTRSSVSFACQHAITTTVSPLIVRALTADDGRAVRVRSGNQDECLMQLLAGDVDFAVMYGLPGEQASSLARAFETVPLGSDLLLPVCAPDLQATTAAKKIPVISYPSDVFLGRIFDRCISPFLPVGVTVETKAETALTLAAFQFARSGIGIAWLPQSLVNDALALGQLVRLDDVLPSQMLEIRIIRLSECSDALANADWRAMLAKLGLSSDLERLPDALASLVQPLK